MVQLYVHDVKSSLERPEKELKAFDRIFLKKGEKRTIEFELGDEAFAFWSEAENGWTIEPGEFEIRLGSSSTDTRLSAKINL